MGAYHLSCSVRGDNGGCCHQEGTKLFQLLAADQHPQSCGLRYSSDTIGGRLPIISEVCSLLSKPTSRSDCYHISLVSPCCFQSHKLETFNLKRQNLILEHGQEWQSSTKVAKAFGIGAQESRAIVNLVSKMRMDVQSALVAAVRQRGMTKLVTHEAIPSLSTVCSPEPSTQSLK